MRLFDELCIETTNLCNRTCSTCLRQSYPERERVAGRFERRREMDATTVYSIITQAAVMGFCGRVCLQHFNEPLLDRRIADFGRYAKSSGLFREVYINTNGDLLTPALDGAFDRLNVALYDGDKPAREAAIRAMFQETALTFTDGSHVVTHHSPFANLGACVAECRPQPCERECQMRCIIDYRGEMLLCCDDIAGEFGLGNIHDTSLHDLWYGAHHAMIVKHLAQAGGRHAFAYCHACPRPNTPYWSTLA